METIANKIIVKVKKKIVTKTCCPKESNATSKQLSIPLNKLPDLVL